MRPSFVLEARCRTEDAMAVLRERIDGNPQGVEGSFSRRHGVLSMPALNRRFWSPCLDLTVGDADEPSPPTEGAEDAVKVWGTFSPRPEIWTGFVFAIGVLTILSILSLFFGVAQVMLGHPPWALLIPLVAILVAFTIYASALVGQGLSGDDMYRMRAFVDACISEAQESARRRPRLPSDASAQL
jgi:hypothetical protein